MDRPSTSPLPGRHEHAGTRVETSASRERPDVLRRMFPVLLLAALCIAFSISSRRFLTPGNALIVLQQAVVLAVAALGMTFVVIAGSIDLSVGSIVALAALAAAASSNALGVFAIVPALLVGLACGFVNGVVVAKGKVPSFIVTLGTMVVFRGIVLYFTRGAPVSIESESFLDFYSGRSLAVPNAVWIAVAVVLLGWVTLRFTVFARELKATGGGERVARLTGIRIDRVKIAMFTLLGLLCGIAGLLQSARAMAATSQLGEGLELDVIAAVVVGGTPLTGGLGSVQGTILGVLIITILSNGMNMAGVDPYLQNIVKGVVLIAAVFITIDRKKIGIIK
ncbi:ABC transporter permease [Paraburkholderia sp. SARCC-3016]|uniref:ABC transporter permease n=1 Tax=Paraburkholderia sp. SARCC-3016 TaxID=3058611 RepID=UPI0028091700|nr:ABC transporter permease [Paraburkholderia sp. SARCC-3016]MDQ7981058.1 ABC transporter permease [Paraburkholderia sp. SARCC-3016]